MANGTYTQEGIMAQIFVAFGQGTGAIRVSQAAAVELRSLYFDAITADVVDKRWVEDGVQVLERIRAIGRLCWLKATERGDTTVSPEDVEAAAKTVEMQSDTDLCPPRWT
jgi:histone H3/H4